MDARGRGSGADVRAAQQALQPPRLRRCLMAPSDDRGTTVAELAVVMVVSSIALALAAQFVISIARDANAASVAGNRVDSVRLALDGVERQVRSGDALYLESAGGLCR